MIEFLYDTIIETGKNFGFEIGVIIYFKYRDNDKFDLLKHSYEYLPSVYSDRLLLNNEFI